MSIVVPCSYQKCRLRKPMTQMLHVAGAFYCSENCMILQLQEAVKDLPKNKLNIQEEHFRPEFNVLLKKGGIREK